jgi:hypothetical protein
MPKVMEAEHDGEGVHMSDGCGGLTAIEAGFLRVILIMEVYSKRSFLTIRGSADLMWSCGCAVLVLWWAVGEGDGGYGRAGMGMGMGLGICTGTSFDGVEMGREGDLLFYRVFIPLFDTVY